MTKDSATIVVYGASDDLVEIEGAVRAEIDRYDSSQENPVRIRFSEGTVLDMFYDESGCWRAEVKRPGLATVTIETAEGYDTDNYSDRVTLTYEAGPLKVLNLARL